MDQFADELSFAETASIVKLVSPETLLEFGKKLVSYHRPITFDYAAKFGIVEEPVAAPRVAEERLVVNDSLPKCESCGVGLESKTVYFCRINKSRFGGKFLCRTCQGTATPPAAVADLASDPDSGAACAVCGTAVDSRVVAFCRFNGKRFGKRVLCRGCQGTVGG